LDNTIRLVV